MTKAMITAALQGAQVLAAMGRGMARGAVAAGREVGGTSGRVVAGTVDTALAGARRAGDVAAETAGSLAGDGRGRRSVSRRRPAAGRARPRI